MTRNEGGRPRHHGGKATGCKVLENLRALVPERQIICYSNEMQKQGKNINIKVRIKDAEDRGGRCPSNEPRVLSFAREDPNISTNWR